MADYTDLIQSAARQYNIDPALLQAVIRTESSGNPNAKGPPTKYGAARGIAQLLPQTAAALGVKNPNDPAEAIPAMAKLLDQNLTRYGNVEDALHAYHGGTDQANWGPKTQAYAQTVLSRVNQPKNLPGIPSSANNNTQSDEDIFAAMSGAPKQSAAQPGTQSDDAIFQAMTRQDTKAAPQQTAAPIAAPAGQPTPGFLGSLQSAGAGAGKAFGEGMLGLQSLYGKALKAQEEFIANHPVAGRLVEAVTNPAQAVVRAFDQTPTTPTLSSLITGQRPQSPLAQAGQWLINDAAQGRAKLEAENAPYMAAAPIANVGGQIVGTVAPGAAAAKGLGAVGNVAARTIGAESVAAPFIQAISTGGASSGGLSGLAGLGARAAGGAITGAGMGAVYSPDNIGTSAAISGAVPVIGAGLGAAGRYGANLYRSLKQPFTEAGQQEIAQNIIRNAAQGAPVAMNTAEMVPGSIPTLAEATNNPGIATLQRTMRDLNPNAFAEREASNAAARLSALGEIVGTPEQLSAARLSRAAEAADNYLSTNVSIPTSDTVYQTLKKTPAFQSAFKQAQDMAKNQGVASIERTIERSAPFSGVGGQTADQLRETYVSGRGLQYVKQALDDQIDSAMRSGETGKARNILGIKDKLVGMMDEAIPDYANARAQFASQSGPIDAMQYLQSLRLVDAQGNVTLAKIQNALAGLQKAQSKPGLSTAKNVTPDQITALSAIRDDLLRQSQTQAGKSVGSATGQNLAMQNMLRNALPGKIGSFAANAPAGSIGGAGGAGLGYLLGGPMGAAAGTPIGAGVGRMFNSLLEQQNQKIAQNITDMMLNSPQGIAALQNAARSTSPRLQVSRGIQGLMQPGAVGSLMQLNRQPVVVEGSR